MKNEDVDRVWALMEKIGFCMLATMSGDDIRARPMSAIPRRSENAIYFLADSRRHKEQEIAGAPNVNLAFADTDEHKYVAVAGRALVTNNRQKIRELWSTPALAWWDSPDDPNIRLLIVTPKDAEYWDSPGSAVSNVRLLTAAVTGTRPDLGEHQNVAF